MTKKVKKITKKNTKKVAKVTPKTDKAFLEFAEKEGLLKKRPIKIKRVSDPDSEVQVEPVVDISGAVVMRSIDDPGEITKNKGTVLKPSIDKETGVLTMVPVSLDDNK
jgi:hypothetical protein